MKKRSYINGLRCTYSANYCFRSEYGILLFRNLYTFALRTALGTSVCLVSGRRSGRRWNWHSFAHWGEDYFLLCHFVETGCWAHRDSCSLVMGGGDFCPGVKLSGTAANHLRRSSAEGKERLGLYLCSRRQCYWCGVKLVKQRLHSPASYYGDGEFEFRLRAFSIFLSSSWQ
jgi:hypothetical protein